MNKDQYNLLATHIHQVQTAVTSLWMALQETNSDYEASHSINLEGRISNTATKDNTFPRNGSWYDRIEAILRLENRPLTAREIMNLMAPLLEQEVEKIKDRVNTNCSTMRHEGKLSFIANHPGSIRGKYILPSWSGRYSKDLSVDSKEHYMESDSFREYRQWLRRNNVDAGVSAYVSRLRMFEARARRSIGEMLEQDGLERTLERINSQVYRELSPGTLSDMRTAVRKYAEFLNSQKN